MEKDKYIFINRTTHEIKVERGDGEILIIPAASTSLRMTDVKRNGIECEGIPINDVTYIVENLPPEEKNTFYIVSKLVAKEVKRRDFIAPDTGQTCVRVNGEVDVIRGFVRFAEDK